MVEINAKESPFYPGKPVPIEYFTARISEIERLERSIKQTLSGRNENIFIMGERGIGKSSLAAFIHYIAEKEYDFIGTHCYLGGARDLNEMVRLIFQRLFQEVKEKSIFEKLKNIFDDYIKEVKLFGMGVEFTKNPSKLHTILDNFLPTIRKINETIKDNKKGIILILDDLNGISRVTEFAHFLKSFVDELATSRNPLPLLIIFVGIPEIIENMVRHQPSVTRIFDIIDLFPMGKSESRKFFINNFNKVNISVSEDALYYMVDFSGGFPMLMHELGDAIFWLNKDNHIDEDDAIDGLIEAAEIVGRKHLDPQVYQVLRSETYRSILIKIGKIPLGKRFQRKNILEKAKDKEYKTLDNFLHKVKDLGIINKTENRGEYKFANMLYHYYIRFGSLRVKNQGKRFNKK